MSGPRYRFRDGVSFRKETEKIFLVSRFPLKAVRISPEMQPLFERLAARSEAAFDELHCLVPRVQAGKLECFLNRLVNRGFLEETRSAAETVSVVIPVHNRPGDIAACLSSLSAVDNAGAAVETIVVDDGSTDETAEVISRFEVKRLLTGRRRGASFCRNHGASRATGDILVFLDSDCTVDEGWVGELLAAFRDPEVTASGGLVDSREDKKGLDRYEQAKSSLMMGRRRRDSRDEGHFFYLPSCNLAVKKEHFLALGGFREDLAVGEDVDLCWRLVDKGGVIVYRPSAVVYHRHRNALQDFCARRFDYGTSEPLLQRLHPNRRKQFILHPCPFTFWTLFALALVLSRLWLLIAPCALLFSDALRQRQRVRRSDLNLSLWPVIAAMGRVYAGFLYQVAAFASRYYLLPAAMLVWIWPTAALAVTGGHLIAGLVQYAVHRPRLSPFTFLFYFTLEQVSYQAGVWWGCLKALFWSPVLPRLCLGAGRNE